MSPEGGKAGTLYPLLLHNTSGTGARLPDMIPDLFTRCGALSILLFPLPLCLLAWALWSQELPWLLTRAALLLNEQKKNK